jgi:hypothetical protein
MYRPANILRNMRLAQYADLVVTPTPDAAGAKSAARYAHTGITVQGIAFEPTEIVAIAELPAAPKQVAGVDYDPDREMCQDDYERLTRTGLYAPGKGGNELKSETEGLC